jgi:hypothetical protein
MLELKNLQGQVLLKFTEGQIQNNQGQALARTEGTRLLNLKGQILAEVENGCVFRERGVTLLRAEGSQILNVSGQHLATVDEGSQDDTALLAAAYLVFLLQ